MFHIPTDNTYKMEPDVKFQPHKVEEVMRIILEEDLTDKAYSARDSQNVCKALTVKIRKAVKELNFSRYKIIVHVTIGQLKRQSFQSASRFLWDHKTDDHASANFKNDTLFCTATVFGVYYEWNLAMFTSEKQIASFEWKSLRNFSCTKILSG